MLKASMDHGTATVLATKRLCLWKYLLETTSFSDMGVVDLVVKGIPLYGSHSKPPNFSGRLEAGSGVNGGTAGVLCLATGKPSWAP